MIDRRSLLVAGLAAGAATSLPASASAAVAGIETLPLWPGTPPGGEAVSVVQRSVRRSPDGPATDIATYGVTRPTLAIVRPREPNGAAVLMIPGGGYERVAMPADGGPYPRLLAAQGYTVGALLYRLPYDGWAAGPDAPLQDAQRALRLLRARGGAAARPSGVVGFSAGGHLAGRLAAAFGQRTYPRLADEPEGPARPDFAALFSAVVTMADPHAHGQSRRNLIGRDPDDERIRRWSLERNVPEAMPPTFIAHATDDRTVPAENSIMLFQALRARGVDAVLHLFDVGGHGFGRLTDRTGPGRYGPELLLDWLSRKAAELSHISE